MAYKNKADAAACTARWRARHKKQVSESDAEYRKSNPQKIADRAAEKRFRFRARFQRADFWGTLSVVSLEHMQAPRFVFVNAGRRTFDSLTDRLPTW